MNIHFSIINSHVNNLRAQEAASSACIGLIRNNKWTQVLPAVRMNIWGEPFGPTHWGEFSAYASFRYLRKLSFSYFRTSFGFGVISLWEIISLSSFNFHLLQVSAFASFSLGKFQSAKTSICENLNLWKFQPSKFLPLKVSAASFSFGKFQFWKVSALESFSLSSFQLVGSACAVFKPSSFANLDFLYITQSLSKL